METTHRVVCGDSRDLSYIDSESVELVVTSPPYPMIELWDDLFTALNHDIRSLLEDGDDLAFERMHQELDSVWEELARVVCPGGIVCINIGDATRKVDDVFQIYPNHSRIISAFRNLGFVSLPSIIWRKPTNKASKFMGSGLSPPNAYVTLEHEHILIFRKGGLRQVTDSTARGQSSYFWEERNEWFCDLWEGIIGESQKNVTGSRDHAASYPFEIPYRLIQMFSIYGDTVLDPFAGTGTTAVAAAESARNSINGELDSELITHINERLDALEGDSEIGQSRLEAHTEFVESTEREFSYQSELYGFPVTAKQEVTLRFYQIESVSERSDGRKIRHSVIEGVAGST